MQFKKYQHLEKLGTTETEGITQGGCYVFPKIDGTNAQLWWDGQQVRAGSRNRELALDNDNAGFLAWASKNRDIRQFFENNPDKRLYGEWLVPHTLKTYQQDAWYEFYVFDVMIKDEYLTYPEYKAILDFYYIEYIPPMCYIENPTYERLMGLLEQNTFLIEDGKGTGEGIVIKNYGFKNKYGRTIWAKIVKNEFKTKLAKVQGVTELKERTLVEEQICRKYVTDALVHKEYAKIDNEKGFSSKDIPRLLSTVFYCLVKEESWNYVKTFKKPTVDYKKLNFYAIARVKEVLPHLF